MVFDTTFLKLIAETLNPLKLFGNIRDAVMPALGAVDSYFGYENFELSYNGLPKEINDNTLYLYQEAGQIYCITKNILDQNNLKESNIKIPLTEDILNKKTFNELKDIFSKPEEKKQLSTGAKSIIYDFLSANQFTLGNKYAAHHNLVVPYRKAEQSFYHNHPNLRNAYFFCKSSFNNLCTFAKSQTGIRIASLASATAIAVASGGTVPLILVGAYAGSMCIAIAQQAYSRMSLNQLTEEDKLLIRYRKNNDLLIDKCNLNIIFPKKEKIIDHSIKGQLKKWATASGNYLATYICEAAIPVISAFLSPATGVIEAAQFAVFTGLAALNVGLGISARKQHEDKKEELRKNIDEIKALDSIPEYKNVAELKKLIIEQEGYLQKRNILPKSQILDPELQEQSKLSRYWKGLKEVLNPFVDSTDVNKAFYKTAAAAAVPAAIMLASPLQLSPLLAASITAVSIASAGMAAETQSNFSTKKDAEKISSTSQQSAKQKSSLELEIAQIQAQEIKHEIHLANRGAIPREKVTEHPLKSYKGALKRDEVKDHPLSYTELAKKHSTPDGERSK